MTDWRETGEQLRQKWCTGRKLMLVAPSVIDESFNVALLAHVWDGKPERLIAYLRSGRPLTAENREDWARALEGEFDRKPERGRPRKRDLRVAVAAADWFYRNWRRENKEHGISDWGNRDEMKDAAISIAIEIEGHDVDPVAVRELMDRPKSRRK